MSEIWALPPVPIKRLERAGARPKLHAMPKSTPLQFDVPEIHCQACVDAITAAIHRVDPKAEVTVDLQTKRVVIGADGEAPDFIQAIEDAGYDVKAAA